MLARNERTAVQAPMIELLVVPVPVSVEKLAAMKRKNSRFEDESRKEDRGKEEEEEAITIRREIDLTF